MLRVAMYGTKHPHASSVAQALADCATVDFCGVFEPDLAQVSVALADPRLSAALAGVPVRAQAARQVLAFKRSFLRDRFGVQWFTDVAELWDESIVGVVCEGGAFRICIIKWPLIYP